MVTSVGVEEVGVEEVGVDADVDVSVSVLEVLRVEELED